jgi:hypothetical protein
LGAYGLLIYQLNHFEEAKVVTRFFLAIMLAALVMSSSYSQGAGRNPKDEVGPVEVSTAVQSDISDPVRDLEGLAPSEAAGKEKKEKPLRLIPPLGPGAATDTAVQNVTGPLLDVSTGIGFAGVGNGDYGFSDQYAPPDTNGAVGASQYVQWVNTYFAVFDKVTGLIASGFPKAGNAVWKGFGGGCEANNDGDPIVQYDKAANRWILTQFSVSTKPYLQCVAVSATSDATGQYYRYAFSYGSTQFNDYPKLGVWPDGYYASYNIFNNGTTFAGAKVCAFDRIKMLAGDTSASQQCFQLSSSYGSLLPADLDGSTPPPSGSPEFFLNFGTNSLRLWKFGVNWTNPAISTLTGPVSVPVASFAAACNGGGACIPQPGTRQKLDSLGDRLMYRLAYRNFGNHEALVVNHSVGVGTNKKNQVSSVRWYELRNPSNHYLYEGTPVVYQQGTLGTGDGIHRWMGSIAMDKLGNIALGYSASSGTIKPSIRYTGHLVSDPLNTMASESVARAGGGSQLQNLNRWGDYSSMTLDPVDDCTFWYTNEYLKSNGIFNWSTWITSFKFPGCQ